MDRETQTSFIPKTVLTKSVERMPQTLSLSTVISTLALLLSLALWGGTYAYRGLLKSSIEDPCVDKSTLGGATQQSCGLKESINKAREDLDQATTIFLKRLNDKLLIGEDLVNQHKTTTPVFKMLEELTLPSVYYSHLSYSGNTLTIDGRASSYEDIAVQTQVFARDQGRIKSFIFSDLDLDSFGNVVFKLVLNLEPEVTSYIRSLTNTTTSPTTDTIINSINPTEL